MVDEARTPEMARLVETLRAVAIRQRLSQETLASRIGVRQSVISDWFRGTKSPNLASLQGILRAFPELTQVALNVVFESRREPA